jgi:formate dehydrogenase alpha subunit
LEMITITLNGREVSGQPGMTILDIARESGITIPTLCHDPNLASYGACRICTVEDERSGALMASCVTPIAPGMVISTQSPRVKERRETIIKLMLSSHPDTCMVCDKGNCCELRKIAADMGIGLIEFQRIPQLDTIEEVNPFIQRDLSKCILCAKCIRADQELVVEGAIDYLHRGFTSKPATLHDLPLEKSECTFCGTCVAMCPTGALSEKEKTYRGAVTQIVHSICPYCGCGCGISLEIKDNRLIRCTPDENNNLNHGTLCVRGSYGYDFVHSPERLTTPMVKADNDFKAISWEEALNLVVSEFKRIKDTYGPDSLAVFGSSKCTNEENYLLQRFTRCSLGTNNIDNGSRIYNADSYTNLGKTFGFLDTTSSLDNLDKSQVILVIGANASSSSPLVGYAIKRAAKYKGTKLILIDPQQIKLSLFAHIWLQPRVGTDIVLLNGLAKITIDEGLLNKDYIKEKTIDFEVFAHSLKKYTPKHVEKITGVPAKEIQQAARIFAEANPVSIVYGNGITQQVNGTICIIALANLAMLTGNVRGIYALQRENNGQGACDMGVLPNFLPGFQKLDDVSARKNFESRWGCRLPANQGLTALEMLQQANEGNIKGMYIVGENPALSFPQPGMVKQALESLEFLVVQDIFLTETAKLAKVVLPASSFAEKEGTFTNFEGRVQKLNKALQPLGNSLPDWEIVLKLANTMGYPMPYSSANDVMNEIKELVRQYQNTNHGSLKPGSSQLTNRHFLDKQATDKCLRFFPVEHISLPNPPDGYPFTLIAGSTLHHFGSGTRSSRSTRLKKFLPEAFAEIDKSDAESIGVENGDRVKISSPAGEVTAIARITDMVSQGTIFMPISFPDNPVTTLFDFALDPQSKTPALKTCSVKIEGVESHGRTKADVYH